MNKLQRQREFRYLISASNANGAVTRQLLKPGSKTQVTVGNSKITAFPLVIKDGKLVKSGNDE